MNAGRILIDRDTAKNLEILAKLWGHDDLQSIVASCVRRVTFEEIERARTHANPSPRACSMSE